MKLPSCCDHTCCLRRRFVLQPGALPPGARLSAQLGMLRVQCAELDAAGCSTADRDFADVLLRVEGRSFRQGPFLLLALICAR